ncbi:MAG: serine hydrolase [Saprospiraceae bacterium]|nr:serine hydrolase [Saprospiraceae bacterium]
MRYLLPIFAFAFLFVHLNAQNSYTQETLQKIKEVENNICGSILINDENPVHILDRMALYNVKGLSLAVIKDHKIAWAKGYGWADEEEKRPVTTETLFEPGSISKSLNAVGILKLVQDGKLDLNTDINAYLKSWKFPYDSLSNGKKITLAHLLSHTAGLTVHGFPGHDIKGPVPSLLQVLDGIPPSFTPAVRSQFEPGLRFQYSGGGTSISQIILTDHVQQPYEDWMYANVLRPIGMVNSTYAQPPSEDFRHKCASAYNNDGLPIDGKFHVYPEQAAAGLWMTPSDLCEYIIDMQLAYQGKPSKVLNEEMVKLHLTPHIDQSAAMGTFIEDHDGALYFQHGAGNDGFCGQFYGSLTDGYGVVIFLNTESFKILGEVINSVAKAYGWKNFYNEPKRKTSISIDEKLLQSYEGIYLFDNTWAGVGKKDNEYHFFTPWTFAKMHFTSPTSFFNVEFRAVKEFIKDHNGNITGYTRTVEDKPYPPSIKITNVDTLQIAGSLISEIGWYLFEIKDFKSSLKYFKRGNAIYPEDHNMAINLAHLYLYNNEFEKAKEIYQQRRKEIIRAAYSGEDLMRDDYTYLKNKKFDLSPLNRMFDELKITKP